MTMLIDKLNEIDLQNREKAYKAIMESDALSAGALIILLGIGGSLVGIFGLGLWKLFEIIVYLVQFYHH